MNAHSPHKPTVASKTRTQFKRRRPEPTGRGRILSNYACTPFEVLSMAASRPIDVQFSPEELHRRGVRDRLRNPPVVDDSFDSLLARLQSRESDSHREQSRSRLPIFRHCARQRSAQKHKP